MLKCCYCDKIIEQGESYQMLHIMHWHCYDDYLEKQKNKYLEKEKEKEDIINNPNHYHNGIQPIEAIETNFEQLETNGFLKGNVIKYVLRSNKKGKELEDLKKAQWNLNKLIERMENK